MNISTKGLDNRTIYIEEIFRAPYDKVFKAWTTPESLKKWFLAEDGVTVINAELDLEVGGSYLIEVLYPGYEPSKISGEFLEVKKPNSLEYTWLTPVLNGRKTKVDVEFIALDSGSKIQLTHGEFNTTEEMQLHIDGWKGCIRQLSKFLGE